MWNPLSWVMEAAALVAIALSNGEHRPPDWEDFVGIVTLLIINSAIGFYEERNAGNAVKALMDSLAPKAKVKRAGQWREIESSILVPGDMISFKIGDIVPADCRLTESINLSWVMEAAALVAIALSNGEHRPPDWEDFVGIVTLLIINSAIGFYEERNAGNAVKALMDSLAPKAKVKRAGQWREIESSILVPGDMISFKIGDIVPAD